MLLSLLTLLDLYWGTYWIDNAMSFKQEGITYYLQVFELTCKVYNKLRIEQTTTVMSWQNTYFKSSTYHSTNYTKT